MIDPFLYSLASSLFAAGCVAMGVLIGRKMRRGSIAREQLPPRFKLRTDALYIAGILVALDIISYTSIRIIADSVPVVAGDLSKVGIGFIGGLLMNPGRPSQRERLPKGDQ